MGENLPKKKDPSWGIWMKLESKNRPDTHNLI
jgi:hypothetical protein